MAGLIKDLAADAATLVRQEIGLVKAEVRQNIRSYVKHTGEIAAGGSIALVGLLVLVAFAIIGLGLLLGGIYWLSALIVAVLLLAGGGLLAWSGVRQITGTSVKPEASVESLQRTRSWAGDEVSEFRHRMGGGERLALPSSHLSDTSSTELVARPELGGKAADRPVTEAPAGRPGKPVLPTSVPLLKRVVHEFGDDEVMGQAARVAFFMFTSLPPALLVGFALTGLFGGDRLAQYATGQLQQVLPGSASDPNSAAAFISRFVEQVVQTDAPGPLSIGLISGLWAASAVFVALTESLNAAYDVTESRSWIRRRAIAVGVMVGFLALFILGSVVLLAGPQIAGALDLGGAAELTWSILQWPVAFLLVVSAFGLVYYVLPNRSQAAHRVELLKASAVAAGLWLLATLGFRLYIANFGSYGETYGFVGAILVLLLWMYLTGIVILLGGELASEMERS